MTTVAGVMMAQRNLATKQCIALQSTMLVGLKGQLRFSNSVLDHKRQRSYETEPANYTQLDGLSGAAIHHTQAARRV